MVTLYNTDLSDVDKILNIYISTRWSYILDFFGFYMQEKDKHILMDSIILYCDSQQAIRVCFRPFFLCCETILVGHGPLDQKLTRNTIRGIILHAIF